MESTGNAPDAGQSGQGHATDRESDRRQDPLQPVGSLPTPVAIEVENGAQKLLVTWNDGVRDEFPLFGLRRNCPCVMCRGGHELMDRFEPGLFRVDGEVARKAGYEVVAIRQIGRHAIRIRWNDGHDDGMYRFENLRYWGQWMRDH